MNTAVLNRLDTFQLKGLRNILKLTTTYINGESTNDYVRTQINNALKAAGQNPLTALTDYHKQRRIIYLCRLIHSDTYEPGTSITFDPETLQPIDHGTQRSGQPRLKWFKATLQDLWLKAKKEIPELKYASILDPKNSTHIESIKLYAKFVIEKRSKS